MGMRHITASFANESNAVSAATELQAMGALEVAVDRIPRAEFALGVPVAAVPLGALGLGTNGGVPFVPFAAGGFAAAADREPRGFPFGEWDGGGAGGFRPGGTPVVTAAVKERMFKQAEEIVRRNGGVIES